MANSVEIICGEHGVMPVRGTSGSAGYDFIYNFDEKIVIKPGSKKIVDLDVKISLPENTVMFLKTRSSFAVKGIMVLGGVIDCDYRGTLKTILLNTSDEDFLIIKGMKITQGVILNYNTVEFKKTTNFTTKTERGEGAFGSTNKHWLDPVHPFQTSLKNRILSFQQWDFNKKPSPNELAKAGFFYTGEGDKTKCFHCDVGLSDWTEDDIPWEQHAIHASRCVYLNMIKGKKYITNVISNLKQ